MRMSHFNSHAHVERDGYVRKYCQNYIISTHTLTWSVTSMVLQNNHSALHFNSHAHVERDGVFVPFINSDWYFNSHAHVERDALQENYIKNKKHFNSHAHVERDQFFHVVKTNLWHFNSHAHVERDVNVFKVLSLCHISTHTLTWSVTSTYIPDTMLPLNFNSHAHVERDGMSLAKTAEDLTFQLTRSRGAWLYW